MDQAREIGRTLKAAARVRAWVAEAREDVAAALASERPAETLAQAARALNRAAARLVQVDRERAVEEADIALAAMDQRRGDESLIAQLVHAALTAALAGEEMPAALAASKPQLAGAIGA